MKELLAVCAGWLLLMAGLLSGCTGEKNRSDDSPLWEDMEELEDSVPKATAIAWVDCDRNRSFSSARTVKVKAYIHYSGKISILEYVKKPPLRVQSYLRKRLEVYRVPKVLLEDGYIQPGEQYLQLRYIPEWMGK